MPTLIKTGEKIQEIDIFEMLPAWEGDINIYYGRIGGGKTSAGTREIESELRQGQIVYGNWKIEWNGYDEREDWKSLIWGLIGFQREFIKIPKENYHFWNFVEATIDGKTYKEYFNDPKVITFIDVLAKLTDCRIHLDEGHIPFDSYEAARMNEQKRSAVFATRHFDRGLTIYTQRVMSVHINLRGNINRYYKCEKTFDFKILRKRFIHFLITEFQDTKADGTPDETRLKDEEGNETGDYMYAVDHWTYWGTKKHFAKFNSKYLRGNAIASQKNLAEAFTLKRSEMLKNLFGKKLK